MRHRKLPYLRRPVQIPRWAIATATVVVGALVATTAWAAITPNYNTQCVVTPKSNGGQVLDCDPIAAPSTSPSTSPSASPSPSSSPTTPPSPTASPSPTTPSPSASTTAPATTPPASPPPTGPQRNCQADPGRCGYPDALTTGPTAPLSTTNRTQYTTAGERVVNVQINGCVEVSAAGVTFANVVINAVGCFYGVRNYSTGLSIVDSEITCGGANGTGVTATNYSLTRVDIHDCENGLNVGGNVSIVDSWIHGGVTANGAHTDGIQINQGATNVLIRHNTIVVPTPGSTSAIISWNEESPNQQNVVIDANLLAGGTYTLYCPRQGTSDTRVTNNRFGNYQYGSIEACGSPHTSVWTGNVRDSDNAPVGR